jgi:hypothetical protein
MVSNKILDTMRSGARRLMAESIGNDKSFSIEDKFGNKYWFFPTLKDGITFFAQQGDADNVDYLKGAAKSSAEGGLCSIDEVLNEP